MKLGKYSRARFLESVYLDGVVSGFWHSPALYLLYGIEAGSFFTAVLANDFFGAMTHSHPSNSVNELKKAGNLDSPNLARGSLRQLR